MEILYEDQPFNDFTSLFLLLTGEWVSERVNEWVSRIILGNCIKTRLRNLTVPRSWSCTSNHFRCQLSKLFQWNGNVVLMTAWSSVGTLKLAFHVSNDVSVQWRPGLSSRRHFRFNPLNTWGNNNVVITSKRRHFDVITSKWRRFDVITTSLLRDVSAGNVLNYTDLQPIISTSDIHLLTIHVYILLN